MSKQNNVFLIDLEKKLNFNKQLLSGYAQLNVLWGKYVAKRITKTISLKNNDYERIIFSVILFHTLNGLLKLCRQNGILK